MTIKSLKFTFLSLVIMSGVVAYSGSVSFAKSPAPTIKITLPQTSLDFSDLDLRDILNRKITSHAKHAEMQRLFTNGLNNLLLNNLTPHAKLTLDWLSKKWDTISGWLKRHLESKIYDAAGWVQNRKLFKTWVRISHVGLGAYENVEFYWRHTSQRTSFLYLVSSIITSTIILR